MMKELKQYRSFQVNVAPGVYGGFTLIGAFVYFISGNQWLFTIVAWLAIVGIAYIDKPFKFILLNNKLKLVSFLGLISVSLILPPAVFILGEALGELVGMMLIPIGGILTGALVYFIYREDILKQEGWVNISGQWE